jgi:hypothetical protein
MLTNTYSDRVNIIKYVKLDEGWRFAPLARKPNGNIRCNSSACFRSEMSAVIARCTTVLM